MQRMAKIGRMGLGALCLAVLAGCAGSNDLAEPPVPLGDFALGYDIVVAKNAQKIAPSREATPEELKTALQAEIGKRFGRYEGDKLYHIAVNVDAYALAIPGVPVVVSPKSALVISVNVWDDAAGAKLNAEPKQMTVLESFSGKTVIGSGLTQSREEQIQNLAQNAAKAIENWLVKNRLEWFGETAGLSEEELAALEAGNASDAAAAGPAADAEVTEASETGN